MLKPNAFAPAELVEPSLESLMHSPASRRSSLVTFDPNKSIAEYNHQLHRDDVQKPLPYFQRPEESAAVQVIDDTLIRVDDVPPPPPPDEPIALSFRGLVDNAAKYETPIAPVAPQPVELADGITVDMSQLVATDNAPSRGKMRRHLRAPATHVHITNTHTMIPDSPSLVIERSQVCCCCCCWLQIMHDV